MWGAHLTEKAATNVSVMGLSFWGPFRRQPGAVEKDAEPVATRAGLLQTVGPQELLEGARFQAWPAAGRESSGSRSTLRRHCLCGEKGQKERDLGKPSESLLSEPGESGRVQLGGPHRLPQTSCHFFQGQCKPPGILVRSFDVCTQLQ